jgi:hypothetical protein
VTGEQWLGKDVERNGCGIISHSAWGDGEKRFFFAEVPFYIPIFQNRTSRK